MTKHHRTLPSLPLSFLVVLVLVGCVAVAAALADDDAETITCSGGWIGDSQQTIPKAWINDGYCDCPFDGKDEPNTNACSGSSNWPGVNSASAARSPGTKTNDFACPQQKNLVLPMSRVNDGICDCCDGTDEGGYTICPDNCGETLRAERELLAKITNDYLIGSRKRDIDLLHFSKLRTSKVAEASKLQEQLNACNADIELIAGTKIVALKRQYVRSRMAAMKDQVVASSTATELLTGLEYTELEALIVHLCQVAGEIAKSDGATAATDDDTCSALRVAAMDLGLSWNDHEDFENYETTMKGKLNMTGPMLQIVVDNAMDADSEDGSPALPSLRWNPSLSSNEGRRRLDEVLDDDYRSMEDDYMGMEEDDDFGDRHRNSDEDRDNGVLATTDDATGKEKEFLDEIENSLFSKTRSKFLTQSQEILDEITNILDAPSPDEIDADGKEGSGDGAGGEPQSDEIKTAPDAETIVDPAAYTMVRNKLRHKQDIIKKGFRWGASAKLLFAFSSLRESNENLKRLVIGTIFYGQISATQVWQILVAILPEYKSFFSESDEENTCASPWVGHCPPTYIYRESSEGSETEYPPSFLIDVANSFCDKEALKFGEGGSGASACSKDIDVLAASSDSFFGYTVPTKRNQESDPFQSMFAPIISLPVDAEGLRSLEDKKKTKEAEKSDLTNAIGSVWKIVGGEDGTALGRDGELHTIANTCFEIVAGKYTYELCMFGGAQQKEGSDKSGTKLGTFKGIEYINSNDSANTGSTRILKWENGAKCWNGPQRSATIHMKCGINHKLISADEPNTCQYVFQMESYLACDDAYKVRMDL